MTEGCDGKRCMVLMGEDPWGRGGYRKLPVQVQERRARVWFGSVKTVHVLPKFSRVLGGGDAE